MVAEANLNACVLCITRRHTNNSLASSPGIHPILMLGASHARLLLLTHATQLPEKALLVLLLLLELKNKIHFAVQNAFSAASTSPRQRRKRASASIAGSSVSCTETQNHFIKAQKNIQSRDFSVDFTESRDGLTRTTSPHSQGQPKATCMQISKSAQHGLE